MARQPSHAGAPVVQAPRRQDLSGGKRGLQDLSRRVWPPCTARCRQSHTDGDVIVASPRLKGLVPGQRHCGGLTRCHEAGMAQGSYRADAWLRRSWTVAIPVAPSFGCPAVDSEAGSRAVHVCDVIDTAPAPPLPLLGALRGLASAAVPLQARRNCCRVGSAGGQRCPGEPKWL
eukprot:CAMPEP_0180439646 /NCGR_PEP_ID=MMETSP1036_2-20121128/12696_1 /TAXON_ID=632150 /ORGANISM="Azadinium spinosum, Strain 3D9" /LENGTH=173 /DNA_ID=CAMNT_0022445793 /DNA_START=153 /DNA_END=671 /DNA_ORIENTATION=-